MIKKLVISASIFCLTLSGSTILYSVLSPVQSHTTAASSAVDDACKEAPNNPYCKTKVKPPTENPVLVTLNKVIKIFALISGIVAVIWIIYGGFRFVTSYGDPQKVAAARETVLYALVGLIIIIAAQSLLSYIISNIAK